MLRTVEIGREFNTRYFIEGSVRKFGEQIKISVALLDIETGDYLWQESHRGEFKDIFDIQEAVAEKVVAGLKLHLTKEEKTLLQERGTENADAYELMIKADEYFKRQTLEGFRHASQLFDDAIQLDPSYARAYAYKGNAIANIYRQYERDPGLLLKAENLVKKAFQIKPDLWNAFVPMTVIYMLQERFDEAEHTAKRYVEIAPDDYHSHSTLGFFYMQSDQYERAIASFEKTIKLKPDDLSVIWNLAVTCRSAKDEERCRYWSSYALPYFERYLKLHPDDESIRVSHSCLLEFAGRIEEARQAALILSDLRDGHSIYNSACLWANLGDAKMASVSLRKAIEAGYRHLSSMKGFVEDECEAFKDTQEYIEIIQMVNKIEAEQFVAIGKGTSEP